MQILFLDESGSVPEKPGSQKYFVIGGVVIPEDLWRPIFKEFNSLKSDSGVTGEIKWRYFSPSNSDKENSLAHLNQEQRNELRNKIYNLIKRRKAVKLISVVASVKAAFSLPSINGSDDLYHLTYKPATERFQYYLQDIERTTGSRTNGIVVLDNRSKSDDNRIQELHQRLLNMDLEYYSDYKNLIEGLFIAPSHWSLGIQLADMVAGAVFRKFERGDDRYFTEIVKSFRKSESGNILGYGLVKVPSNS